MGLGLLAAVQNVLVGGKAIAFKRQSHLPRRICMNPALPVGLPAGGLVQVEIRETTDIHNIAIRT